MYSFCLNPEDYQPSGSCNFSRINSCKLYFDRSNLTGEDNYGTRGENGSKNTLIKTEDNIEHTGKRNGTIFIFGITYNILRFKNGMGGLAF